MGNDRDNDSFRTSTDIYSRTTSDIYGGYDTDYDLQNRLRSDSEAVDGDLNNDADSDTGIPIKKKKKRRKKHYFLRFLLFIACIVGIYAFLTSSIFAIDEIKIQNNTLLSDNEIIELSGVSEGDNMFKATRHKVKKAMTKNPYIGDVSINRELPNVYIISVTERTPIAAIEYEGKYVIVDKDGYAVDYADGTMYATVVSGIAISGYNTGEIPEMDDTAKYNEVLNLIASVNDSGMYFKKVEISSSLTVKGYVTDTLICSGYASDILANVEGIKVVLYDLDQKGVKRGVIKVGEDGYASFSPITE